MARLIVPATPGNLELAVRHLQAGELVGLPTETVYGLAANAWDAAAVEKIFLAKGRPSTNPLIVHVADHETLSEVVALPTSGAMRDRFRQLSSFWPGPLTIVAPRSERIPSAVTAGRDTVAVRIPAHPVALKLLRRCRLPLAAPSANRSNYVSPTTAEHVAEGLGDAVAMVLDGGSCDRGVESTIVAFDANGVRLLRHGAVPLEELQSRLGGLPIEVETDATLERPAEAPGMSERHYSPHTPVHILTTGAAMSASAASNEPVGRIAFAPLPAEAALQYARVDVLSCSGDLDEVAQKLFASLRAMDQAGVSRIDVDACEPVGIGRAIMDRLYRAAADNPASA